MKFNWKKLVVWYLVFAFIGDPILDLFIRGSAEIPLTLGDLSTILIDISNLVIFFFFSVCTSYAFHQFFQKKKWLYLLSAVAIGCILTIFTRYFIQQIFFDFAFGFTNYRMGCEHCTFVRYFRDNLSLAFEYCVLGMAYYFVMLVFFKEKREKALALENQKMELSLLQSQVNPHFLLNSLNNIYSLVFQKSDQSLAALGLLSDILKYSLYEKRVMIPIQEELKYIEKYIDLQRMRFDYPLAIKMEIDENLSQIIPKSLLLPLIENAFKHGDLKTPENPLTIKIKGDENQLSIFVKNKIRLGQKDETGGIGLENLKKRLALIYQNKFTFKAISEHKNFIVDITISNI